jgi:hypothetical protein
MDTPSTFQHPSALALHEYQRTLLPREAAEGIARHLTGCERCRGDLEALETDQRRFDREVFPLTRATVVERRAPRRLMRFLIPSIALLAAGASLLLFAPTGRLAAPGEGDLPGDLIRVKGAAGLIAIFAARDGNVLPVEDGKTRLRAGDRIRFVLWPAGLGYAIIASVDGAGRTTIYHPYGGTESAPLARGPRVEIPGSILLDDSPGPERVFALLSAKPLPAPTVIEALKKLAREGSAAVRRTDRLPIKATQQSILLEKS